MLGRWLYWTGSEKGSVEGSCEHGNNISGSVKFGEVLEQLSCHLLLKKKDPAPWIQVVPDSEHKMGLHASERTAEKNKSILKR